MSTKDILAYTDVSLFELTRGAYGDPVVNFKEASKIHKLKTFGVRKVASKEVAKKVYVKHGSRKKRVSKVAQKVT